MSAMVRSPRGDLLRAGNIAHTLVYTPAFGDALPATVSATVGTSALTTASSSTEPANVRIQTAAATTNSAGRLVVSQAIRADLYEEIEFSFDGLRFDSSAGWTFLMGISDIASPPTRGITLEQVNNAATETFASIKSHTASTHTDHPTHYQFQKLDGASQKPRNVSLIWRPKTNEVFVLEGDQVMVAQTLAVPPTIATTVQLWAQQVNAEAVQHSFKFARLRVVLRARA